MLVKYKWTLMITFLMLALMAAFLLQGMKYSSASGDLTDPFLDPYALSLAHRHAGGGAESAVEKGVRMELAWPQGEPAQGKPSLLSIAFKDGKGAAIEDYVINNEKLLHLIVVSEDLQQFQHVHPVYKDGGVFELSVTFPAAGKYKLYADFMPKGMNELTRIAEARVSGKETAPSILKKSETLTALIGGMKVELSFAEPIAPQKQMSMTYTFTDERTGEKVEDLELYLGAVGHVVAIDQSTEQFIHIHPLNWASKGPQAVFGVSFPASGLYKMWGQFQRHGETFVVPFVIQV